MAAAADGAIDGRQRPRLKIYPDETPSASGPQSQSSDIKHQKSVYKKPDEWGEVRYGGWRVAEADTCPDPADSIG